MTLVKSQQKSGVILVKGVDPPDAISLFCAAPFPQFIVSAMQVSTVCFEKSASA